MVQYCNTLVFLKHEAKVYDSIEIIVLEDMYAESKNPYAPPISENESGRTRPLIRCYEAERLELGK